MLRPKRDVQDFYNSFWKPCTKHKFGEDFRDNQLNMIIASFLESLDGGLALDLGCGEGYLTALIVKKFLLLVGIDISRTGIKNAWKECRDRGEHIKCNFIVADAVHLPFKPLSFDLVVMREVIEHLSNQREAIKEVNRLLKPQGSLFLSTPNRLYRDIASFLFKLVGKNFENYGQIIENQLYPAGLRSLVGPFFKIKKEKGFFFVFPLVTEYLNFAFLTSLSNMVSEILENWNLPSIFAADFCMSCIPKKITKH